MRKQPFTVPIWADEISVEQKSGALVIKGKRSHDTATRGIDVGIDLLQQSRPLPRWGEQRRKMPPHVEFANATTDAKLVAFVRKWGPVDGSPLVIIGKGSSQIPGKNGREGKITMNSVVAREQKKRTLHVAITTPSVDLVVTQDLAELRREQKIFSGAARLIAEIQTEKPNRDRAFEYYSQLPEPEERDFFFSIAKNLSLHGQPFASAVCQRAQEKLCHLLDQFPARLHPTKFQPVELPPLDVQFAGRGIRSVLYFFLRLEYLRMGRLGLGICPHCSEVFAKERRKAVYCGEDCSARHRSLTYYYECGRDRRKERMKGKNE